MAKVIESNTEYGAYDMLTDEMIVELADGRRVYLSDGFGGMSSIEGGMYRWRHGIAIQILATDTLDSLHEDDGANIWMTSYEVMVNGYDKKRPVLNWSGVLIDRIATTACLISAVSTAPKYRDAE